MSAPPSSSPDRTHPASEAHGAIRVMIVDDSLTVRTVFKRMVESDRSMVVTGTASSAERAIVQLKSEPADVVLLDLEMPGMGGLEALPQILATSDNVQVLVVSSLTQDGAEHTLAALSTGAADTMLKPRPGGFNEDYRSQLLAKIRALGGSTAEAVGIEAELAPPGSTVRSDPAAIKRLLRAKRPEVLAVGASTGGIHALNLMLRGLTPEFDLPILVTQHLPSSFMPVFARQIEVASGRRAHIAEDGTPIRPGEIAVATGHGHMIVERRGEELVARISADPMPSGCLPSVDPMLASLAKACEGRALAVILSGMGRDGVEGAAALHRAGGTIYAQDAETSAVWGMPGAVAKADLATLIGPPETLAEAIMALVPATLAR
ncbi:chemotaxis-specific protein-glutamate methyltransferase CheB [Erythrobacter sp.]|uniref:chemotaxis-specific protein-glutamate methyltransferase CheB n=1 Tax=Erythrobacter sp. TaxID=1042 RepID=UPI001425F334|nr:chemotaxis-specific protein-glutamate methyltransferase CheB [Erythrobacter sp.]QIQ86995.1 MAG: chemotaxis-specific protein-glutamate methyltransferase CheB [Erythrobacter sp.]